MSAKRLFLDNSFYSSDQLAKMTCEDAYNWYNKPAAYCSYVDQRFDLEGKRRVAKKLPSGHSFTIIKKVIFSEKYYI